MIEIAHLLGSLHLALLHKTRDVARFRAGQRLFLGCRGGRY